MEETNDLIAVRKQKLEALRALGIQPYGGRFETTGTIAEVREAFAEGKPVRIAAVSPPIATWAAAIFSTSATAVAGCRSS
ncbi:MAG: hypothetical protein QM796_19460 [Chthoniobacteraceae bacterium]